MYKILLVDDESIIRENIGKYIDWNSYGFEFVGSSENGLEALEKMEEVKADVVLTDICMPFLDGIGLSQKLQDLYPDTKVIMLTGYDEFEYAQKAIKLNVFDFIVKPISPKEIGGLLNKVKNELDKERYKIENVNELKKQLEESLPVLKERFLNRLILGQLNQSQLEEKLAYFDVEMSGKAFKVITLDIDDDECRLQNYAKEELVSIGALVICKEVFEEIESSVVFQDYNGKVIVIVGGNSSADLDELVAEKSTLIHKFVNNRLNYKLTIGIGTSEGELLNVYKSYAKSIDAIDYRFLFGINEIIDIKDMIGEGSQCSTMIQDKDYRRLFVAIKTGTTKDIDDAIETIFTELPKCCATIDNYYIQLQKCIVYVLFALNEIGIDYNKVNDSGIAPSAELYNYKTLPEIRKFFESFCHSITNYIDSTRDNYQSSLAMDAQDYIKESYGNNKLTLNAICKHFHISTSYFSTIFKEATGQTFIEYLTLTRINKAKELLKNTKMKTYEIANDVGFNDPHYFGLIFKKNTGSTCTEYRASVLAE